MSTDPEDHGRPTHVRLYNAGDTTFTNWHNGRLVELAPGQSRIVVWDHAAGWLGDPELRDTDRYRARTQEWMRLRVMYGVYEHRHLDDEMLPKLQVFYPVEAPLAEQRRIHMIIDDPDALKIPEWSSPKGPLTAEDRIAVLERELARLREQGAGGAAADGGAASPRNKPKAKEPQVDNTAGLDDLEPDGPVRPLVAG